MTETWQTIVEPKTRLLDIPVKEVLQYRSMIYMLVKRNYQIQYKQTILGPLWIVLLPVFSSGVMSFVFGYVGQFSSDGIPYFLFYLPANVLWACFSNCVINNSRVFLDNSYLFGKVYFPRLVVPISNVIFEVLRLLIQFAVCIAVWVLYFLRGETVFMGAWLLLLPILVLEICALGMAAGIIVSSLTTKYRDLSHLVNFGVQLLMYAAPVLYPVSQLPSGLQKLVLLNPVAPVVEAFRYCVTGSGCIHWAALLFSAVMTVLVLLGSLVLFNQTEKNFIDII